MDDHATLTRLIQISRRLLAAAQRVDPDDPELMTLGDELDEAQQAVNLLKQMEEDEEREE